MSKSLKKLIDINRLREFKNKLVGTDSAYVQTAAVDQTIAGTKTFSEPIVGSVTGSSGSCTGNAASATKLATARTINGTGFNGTANITTANWGTARNISITDGTNTSTAVSVNGSANVSLNLPATIKANLTGNCSGSSGSCTGNAATATKATQDAAGNTITTTYATKSEIIVHVGVIIPFAGKSVPTGYLLCNGAAVSRKNYANLFAAIGTLYGAGNGSTTFNLPDARDRVLQGASGTHSVGSYIGAGLPNITGGIANGGGFYCYKACSGAFSLAGQTGVASANPGDALHPNFNINAHKSNALYGASNTVQSPAIATNFIIKY